MQLQGNRCRQRTHSYVNEAFYVYIHCMFFCAAASYYTLLHVLAYNFLLRGVVTSNFYATVVRAQSNRNSVSRRLLCVCDGA